MRSIYALLLLCVALPSLAASPQKTASKATNNSNSNVHFSNPSTMAKPVSTYSQVVEVTGGKLVFIAGQVALDPAGNFVGKDDFRAQAEQVFKNLKLAVESAGGDMSSIVKMNYFVAEAVDPAQQGAVREIRDRYINTSAPPASTFVVVKRLARPEYLIEVEAVAAVK
jgi:enamine deaminase RidA (YjgF/YER057c/UK114 family)